MHFGTKSYLKSTRNHFVKHTLRKVILAQGGDMIKLTLND